MTFETMDWEAEAKRVAWAFTIEIECEFQWIDGGVSGFSQVLRPSYQKGRVQSHGMTLTARYVRTERLFRLQGKTDADWGWIEIDWNGRVKRSPQHYELRPTMVLAKGLFHLDLLTPAVESALKTTISSHQKLEWTLEYAKRLEAAE